MNQRHAGFLKRLGTPHPTPALHPPERGTSEPSWEESTPSSQGLARKAQAPLPVPGGGGKREAPSSATSQPAAADPQRGVSKPGAGLATSVGTPPAHSILPWRPALFGQVPLTECSQQYSYTPHGSCCVMKTKQCTLREKSWGAGRVSGEQERGTHESPSGLHPKGGPLSSTRWGTGLCHLNNDIIRGRRGAQKPRDE